MKLVVGLGNPGPEYAQTRHNAGFMALARLAQRHDITGVKAKFHGQLLDGLVAGQRALLLCPMTYMNRSGQAVAEAARFHKIDTDDILIVVDEIALPIGRIRMRSGGSAGGHNGLKDIQQHLGTSDYPRLRIGIDPPGRVPQVDYVLGKFSPEQRDQLEPALDRTCDAIESWLSQGIEKTMSLFNADA